MGQDRERSKATPQLAHEICGGPDHNVSRVIHSEDFIFKFLQQHPGIGSKAEEYYFQDGRNSADLLRRVIESDTAICSEGGFELLEFASGYGCVTRHLPQSLPKARITACDIHTQAMDFILNELRQPVAMSCTEPANFRLGIQFDIVFALSFFTHIPDRTWGSWLEALFRHVNVGGSLIFTTHGSASKELVYNNSIDLSDDGYWFVADSEQHDLEVSDYGTTVTSPEYVVRQIFHRLAGRLAFFSQGFWWGHQDVFVVARDG